MKALPAGFWRLASWRRPPRAVESLEGAAHAGRPARSAGRLVEQQRHADDAADAVERQGAADRRRGRELKTLRRAVRRPGRRRDLRHFVQIALNLKESGKYSQISYDRSTGNYNQFWMVDRDWDNRTSLITDPPDGQMPPLTPEAIAAPGARPRPVGRRGVGKRTARTRRRP